MAKVWRRFWCGCGDPDSHAEAKDCPQVKFAWVADYFSTDKDGEQKRHIKTFARKKDADEYLDGVKVEVKQGIHTAPNESITVDMAADDWLTYVEGEKRERSTLDQYKQHIRIHIKPQIGTVKLAQLNTRTCEKFRDDLVRDLSRPMARKVLGSLKSLLKDARRRGNVAVNVAADTRITANKREKRKLKAGVDFPLSNDVHRMVEAVHGRDRAFLMVGAFAGLRSSELRGLRWSDLDFRGRKIHVRQRIDRYKQVGSPKSEAGERTIPVMPIVMNTLDQAKRTAKGDLVFANSVGNVENHANLAQRVLQRAQVKAGVTLPVIDKNGKPCLDKKDRPVVKAKYGGLHTLRHYFAAWSLTTTDHGGCGLTLKELQERLGHATLAMTADTYGHLLPAQDEAERKRLADAQAAMFPGGLRAVATKVQHATEKRN